MKSLCYQLLLLPKWVILTHLYEKSPIWVAEDVDNIGISSEIGLVGLFIYQ